MKYLNILAIFFYLIFPPISLFGQTKEKGIIKGVIYNVKNNEPVAFATVQIMGTTIGSISDLDGRFLFTGIKPGVVSLKISSVGFKTYITPQMEVTNANPLNIDIPMEEEVLELNTVVVTVSPYKKDPDSPISLRNISQFEIEKNPGGNRDISKVIQSYPGVGSTPAFRNDLIVRGGGSSENRFFLDGVEIPYLNHFSTQGASGGPVGILNIDFIREVKFYSGAFPAERGNALSSVLEFKQKDGNKDRLKTRAIVGASDLGLTLDGPLGKNTTFIFSARRSYLQFLFGVLGLPFLPTYNDMQFKVKTKINEKNDLTLIGLGAYDVSTLNLSANETEEQKYILRYLPANNQWSYTFGAVWKHYRENGTDTWVLSRNMLNNASFKYKDNNSDSIRTFDYSSIEEENKFRYERTMRVGKFRFSTGANAEEVEYKNNTSRFLYTGQPYEYNSSIRFYKWGLYGQASSTFFNERLTLSFGIRSDANSYSKEMDNLLKQISPRFSMSYTLSKRWAWNFNTGRYYQMPPYTALGFRDPAGTLVNKNNGMRYIISDHLVSGLDFLPTEESKISLEGFFKYYQRYPFSVNDSIALASKGADFGTYGDEEIKSTGTGRAYGMELAYQNRNLWGTFVTVSYTLVRSEFQNKNHVYIPSAWDNKHLFYLTARREFKGNWNVGIKWRFVGGSPYTPYDPDRSSLVSAWNASGQPYINYTLFNQYRLSPFHQLDIRVDKDFYFDRWTLNIYFDIQNIYGFKAQQPDRLTLVTDAAGNPLFVPGSIPPRYQLRTFPSEGLGTVLPTLGIIVEF